MQIIVDTSAPDDHLKTAVEHALKELEKRTGQEFQVVVKAKGAPTQAPAARYEAPAQQSSPGGSVASQRAEQMKKLMGSVDLSIIGNPNKR